MSHDFGKGEVVLTQRHVWLIEQDPRFARARPIEMPNGRQRQLAEAALMTQEAALALLRKTLEGSRRPASESHCPYP